MTHCHGINCCWDCFHGRPVHPRDAEDSDCQREYAEYGDRASAECAPREIP